MSFQKSTITKITKPTRYLSISLLFFVILVTNCALISNREFVVWSDNPNIIAYVDYYNSLHPNHVGIFKYVRDINPELISNTAAPDVIIARNISYALSMRNMQTLRGAVWKNQNDYYDRLLPIGAVGRKQKFIPLSFNLPILVFLSDTAHNFESAITVTLEEIRNESQKNNEIVDGEIATVGFSAFWDPSFLYLGTVIYGADYTESRQNNMIWQESNIFESLRFFRSWDDDNQISDDALQQFSERYYNEPIYNRILENKIAFVYSDLRSFSKIDLRYRNQLDFRIIRASAGIPILDDITLAGIYKKSRNKSDALDFLKVLLNTQTQKEMIQHAIERGVDLFGIADGLSINVDITERIIPIYAPWLLGHTPSKDQFLTPLPLPKNWLPIRKHVVEPWLSNYLYGIDQRSLESEIQNWKNREEFF